MYYDTFLYKENAVLIQRTLSTEIQFCVHYSSIHVALQCCKTFCKSVQQRREERGVHSCSYITHNRYMRVYTQWSTLLNTQGGETHHSASKQERSHIWTTKYQAQFSVKQRAKRIRVIFFLCASNVYWFTFDKYWIDILAHCVTLLLFLACWTLVNNKCHFSLEVEKRELKYHHIECCLFFTCKDNKTESFECAWCAVKKKHLFDNSILVVLKP